jgi:hypothetical protein
MVAKLVGGARLGAASETSGAGALGGGWAAPRSAGGEQAARRARRGRQERLVRIIKCLEINIRVGEAQAATDVN